jgi:hypothetical protein
MRAQPDWEAFVACLRRAGTPRCVHHIELFLDQELQDAIVERFDLSGGIDVDFLCRSSESEIRARVRRTAEVYMPGGGWCLGTGNTPANYVPMENYLAMIDEGRRFAR